MYGEGIDIYGEVLDLAIEHDIILKSGAWFSYEGDKIGQGRIAVIQLLKDNEELFKEIKNKIIKSMKPKEFQPSEKELAEAV